MVMDDEPPVIEGHISRTFDGELAALHLHVVQMGGLVLKQVQDAANAYTEWQPDTAQRVLRYERDVNDYERTIDAEQFGLIARRAPVASDLKVIVAMAKCIAELERAGDSPQHFDVALDAAFVLKSLERVGDHARNLARQVRGIVNETVARHGLRQQA